MNLDDVIVYGFKLGNADPDFKEFILSLSNTDIHNLRKILYDKKLDSYRDGYGRAMYGLDRYGCVNIPSAIRGQKWTESGNEIYPYLKDLWVYTKLGHDGFTFNPIKAVQWKYWRALVVTSKDEAKDMILSTAIEVGIQYLFSVGFVKEGLKFIKLPSIKPLRGSNGNINGFSISRGGYGAKSRIDYHRLSNPSKKSNSFPSFIKDKKLLHYHRGKGNNLHRHRPWEKGWNDSNFFDRF